MIWLKSNDDRYKPSWDVRCQRPQRWVLATATRGWVIDNPAGDRETTHESFGGPLEALQYLDTQRRSTRPDQRWAGYLGYDLARCFEELPRPAKWSRLADPGGPGELPLLAFALCTNEPAAGGVAGTSEPGAPSRTSAAHGGGQPHTETCDTPRDGFKSIVERGLSYIRAGDIFQVNLARQISTRTTSSPHTLFARLDSMGGARFAALLDVPAGPWGKAFSLLSLSPELFLHLAPSGRIVTQPIKGTRPNAPGMYEELARSEKDRAELAMIVDLLRNDLGRVCQTGSVRVDEARTIHTYPTLLHASATISGTLRPDSDLVSILRATFPCGSVTGCPKIRAMQIIDELETSPRGVYCGSVVSLSRDMLTASVAIRTLTLASPPASPNQTGTLVRIPVGGGIVADSLPDDEWLETEVKARAMRDLL